MVCACLDDIRKRLTSLILGRNCFHVILIELKMVKRGKINHIGKRTGVMQVNLSKILIGTMRVGDSDVTGRIIQRAIDLGSNYIDTVPLYRWSNNDENSETWVGCAVSSGNYRQRVLVSTKSAVSDGGLGLGSYNPSIGFGIRMKEQFSSMLEQSLSRLNLPYVDFYHLWMCHTKQQFEEAFKPGGWYEGLQKAQEDGKIKHLEITTHGDADTIIRFLETGAFETVTLPLNVLNVTRMKAVEYCARKGIPVLPMNPLGGGLLAVDSHLKELAFKYLLSLENVHILVGFTALEEVDDAWRMKREYEENPVSTETILQEVRQLIPNAEPDCTGCGYCQPCPKFIEVGSALSHYNLYHYLNLQEAKKAFLDLQWNPRYKLSNCIACGQCEKRCPNTLPVRKIIENAKKALYAQE